MNVVLAVGGCSEVRRSTASLLLIFTMHCSEATPVGLHLDMLCLCRFDTFCMVGSKSSFPAKKFPQQTGHQQLFRVF